MKFVTEGEVNIDRKEDNSQAIICTPLDFVTTSSDNDCNMSVIIHSWDTDTEHPDLIKLLGRRVKITIEVLK